MQFPVTRLEWPGSVLEVDSVSVLESVVVLVGELVVTLCRSGERIVVILGVNED
jgi:hypothetical protein